MDNTTNLNKILENIKKTQEILKFGKGPKIIGFISGNESDRKYLNTRFNRTQIFNDAEIISVLEETRKGNFLGTLCFYKELENLNIPLDDKIILCGFVFGKGERLFPITNTLKNMKACMPTAKSIKKENFLEQEILIEGALKFFSLITNYLDNKGFKGIVNKWGDEIQVPGNDLESLNVDYNDADIVKFISEQTVTADTAKNKDWNSYDNEGNLTRQIPRRPIEEFEKLYQKGVVKKNEKGEYVCGISTGSVAISHKLIKVASEILEDEIEKNGTYFDFDPYFLMALPLTNEPDGREIWEQERDEKINELDNMMIPNKYGDDFFDKITNIRKIFENRYGKLKLKIFDLGPLYWADLGLHKAMRKNFMNLLKDDSEGFISREIAEIPHNKDENGNRIINSKIGKTIIENSIIINSKIVKGNIKNSIVIDGIYYNVDLNKSFTISDRAFSLKAEENSGSIKTISSEHITIQQGTRHVSIPLRERNLNFTVDEEEDLRDKTKLSIPIKNNEISFRELGEIIDKIDFEEFQESREKAEKKVITFINDFKKYD